MAYKADTLKIVNIIKIFSSISIVIVVSNNILGTIIKNSSNNSRHFIVYLYILCFSLLLGYILGSKFYYLPSLIVSVTFLLFSCKFPPHKTIFSNFIFYFNLSLVIAFNILVYLRESMKVLRK